jgi:hypothetical protein
MCLVKPEYKALALPIPCGFPASCDGLLVKLDSLSLVLWACYRPPSCSASDSANLVSTLESVLELGYNTTILGDLNMPSIDWKSDPPVGHSALDKSLIELYSAWDMCQLVLQPTRSDHILDVIMTTAPAAHAECRVEPLISTSDHCAIICEISAPPHVKHSASVNILDFRHADYALITCYTPLIGLDCYPNIITLTVYGHALRMLSLTSFRVQFHWLSDELRLFRLGTEPCSCERSDVGRSTRAGLRSRTKKPTRRLQDS